MTADEGAAVEREGARLIEKLLHYAKSWGALEFAVSEHPEDRSLRINLAATEKLAKASADEIATVLAALKEAETHSAWLTGQLELMSNRLKEAERKVGKLREGVTRLAAMEAMTQPFFSNGDNQASKELSARIVYAAALLAEADGE